MWIWFVYLTLQVPSLKKQPKNNNQLQGKKVILQFSLIEQDVDATKMDTAGDFTADEGTGEICNSTCLFCNSALIGLVLCACWKTTPLAPSHTHQTFDYTPQMHIWGSPNRTQLNNVAFIYQSVNVPKCPFSFLFHALPSSIGQCGADLRAGIACLVPPFMGELQENKWAINNRCTSRTCTQARSKVMPVVLLLKPLLMRMPENAVLEDKT